MSHLVQIGEEKVGGVTMRVHRLIEKRAVARAIPTADPAAPPLYISERTDIHQVEIVLENSAAVVEPGALQYMHGRIQSEVIRHEAGKGFLARAVASAGTGESAHGTKFSGLGTIWCEPTRKHFILATMDGDKDSLILDDKAFYACSEGISLGTHRHQNITGVFTGNGFMQPKLTGRGVFAVESPVPVEELVVIELKHGEELTVDGDFMLMYSANLTVEIGPLVSGLRNALRSGEGFVYRLRGTGEVYLTPTAKVA